MSKQLQLLHGHIFGNVPSAIISTDESSGTGRLHISQLHEHDLSHFVQHILHLQTVPTDQIESIEWYTSRAIIFHCVAGHGHCL